MLAQLAHRGADTRTLSLKEIWLGERGVMRGRAAQSGDGRVSCVMDGRLFNGDALRDAAGIDADKDASDDARLVAELWARHGSETLSRLDGAFALAIAVDNELYLARDALGERPLYVAPSVAGSVLFASEAKALLEHPSLACVAVPSSLLKVLVFSFVPGRETMFRGIEQLLPGELMHIVPGSAAVTRRYFELREDTDVHAGVDELREALVRAVDKRLTAPHMSSPKRVSAFLSGGIDSSAVVALLASRGAEVVAWSIAFGHGQPNELAYARMVARHTGCEHRVVDIEPQGFIDELPTIVHRLDDPMCDCIVVPNYLLAQHAAEVGPLVFNGEGGDPLFGGPKNKFMILGEWYSQLGHYDRAHAYLDAYHKFFPYLDDLCDEAFLEAAGDVETLAREVRPFIDDGAPMNSFLNRLMHINTRLKGGQSILMKVDKMLSAHGVEPASPLFDKALAELAFRLPPAIKRRGDIEKYCFKKAVEDLLPRPVVYRKKAGMGVPLNFWFKKTLLRELAHDLLTSQCARERGYFQQGFVEELLQGRGVPYAVGRDRSGELLWMLVAIELWHRVFVDGDRP